MGRSASGVAHMTTVTLLAPAKVNLCLEVLGRRPDGYHDVRTVLQAIALADVPSRLSPPAR